MPQERGEGTSHTVLHSGCSSHLKADLGENPAFLGRLARRLSEVPQCVLPHEGEVLEGGLAGLQKDKGGSHGAASRRGLVPLRGVFYVHLVKDYQVSPVPLTLCRSGHSGRTTLCLPGPWWAYLLCLLAGLLGLLAGHTNRLGGFLSRPLRLHCKLLGHTVQSVSNSFLEIISAVHYFKTYTDCVSVYV